MPKGFDFGNDADRAAFLRAVQIGGVLGVIGLGNATDNVDFFNALLGADEEIRSYEATGTAPNTLSTQPAGPALV